MIFCLDYVQWNRFSLSERRVFVLHTNHREVVGADCGCTKDRALTLKTVFLILSGARG